MKDFFFAYENIFVLQIYHQKHIAKFSVFIRKQSCQKHCLIQINDQFAGPLDLDLTPESVNFLEKSDLTPFST